MGNPENHSELKKKVAELEEKIAALNKEKDECRTLFDSLLFGVQVTDAKGTIIYANKAHYETHGYDYGQLIGTSILDLKPTDTEKKELAAYLEFLAQEQPPPTPWIGTDQRKDGSLRDVRVDWNYKRDADGNVVGFISLISDMTEKKKLQKDLHASEGKFQSIFEHSPMAIMYTDERGTITTCNENATRLFGAPEKKLIGFSYKAITNEKMRNAIGAALAGNKSSFEGEYRTVTGNVLTQMKADFSPSFNKDGSVAGVIGIFEDISERRRTEEEISRRKAEFEAIFNSIADAVVFVDQQRKIIMTNKAFTGILGYRLQDVIGKTTELFYADPDEFIEQGETRYHDGAHATPAVYEIDYRRKDGTVFPSETLGTPVKNDTGETIGFIGVIRDISERKKAERELRESEEKYSKLFNSEIDAIAIFDAETREVFDCNDAFLKLYGYSREEALQLKADDVSAEPEKTAASIKDSAEKGNTRVRRRRHKKKDGTEIIVDIAAGPFMLQGRKLMFARLHDITDHVRYEKALHESEERFRIAFITNPDAISITKIDGTYVEINEGFTEMTGYSREDVIGRSSIDINIWDDLEDRKALVEGLQKSDRVENLEAEFRLKDGSTKTGLMSASIIQLHGEPHILSITRDISARKKAQKEKEKLEAQLRQAYKMEAIGTMAGGIAHDFNNILTIILGNADLAKHVTKGEGPAKVYIEHIIEASDRAKEMVRQILAFSRKAKQDLVPLKPHLTFAETLKLLRSTIPSTVQIRHNFDPACRTIKADPTQLNQILMNLSANAVYAMDEKGLIEVSLQEVELEEKDIWHKKHLQPGTYAMLTFSDTGKGMSSEVMERIFDPFFTTKKMGEGTGMGLSVVHGIVESHGGLMSVESTPGQGTTFRLYFPIIDGTARPVEKRGPLHYTGNERILLVDDEESLVEIGSQMLRLLGYQVTTRTSSLDAFETFRTNPGSFDLVITDQTMPNMSGAELAAELLKMRPDIPILLCTGYSSKISDKMAKETGLAGLFMKPFDTEQLAMIVRKTLDRARKA